MVTNNSANNKTGASGTVLQGQGVGTASDFSTATYPATTTINQVLYSSAANVVGGITAANNATMISGTTGIPSWLANGTTGQVLTATTSNPPTWSSNAGGNVKVYVSFTTVTTTTILTSTNVSSLTDNGTGDTTVNFTVAFSTANYAFAFGSGTGNGRVLYLYNGTFITNDNSSGQTSSAIRTFFADPTSGVATDNSRLCVTCCGVQ